MMISFTDELYRNEAHADGTGRVEAQRSRFRTDTPKSPTGTNA